MKLILKVLNLGIFLFLDLFISILIFFGLNIKDRKMLKKHIFCISFIIPFIILIPFMIKKNKSLIVPFIILGSIIKYKELTENIRSEYCPYYPKEKNDYKFFVM